VVEHFFVKFGDPDCSGFWFETTCGNADKQTDRQTDRQSFQRRLSVCDPTAHCILHSNDYHPARLSFMHLFTQ